MILREILQSIDFETLPPNWTQHDLLSFSPAKSLWFHQREALKHAIMTLWKYYENIDDYVPENEVTDIRKLAMLSEYAKRGVSQTKVKVPKKIRDIVRDVYGIENGSLSLVHLINRVSFWMATGSGKTLVIVKLMQILWELMKRGEIPKNDILVLVHRDDLIEQIMRAVREFNTICPTKIIMRDLRQYPGMKRQMSLEEIIPVYYYRSDNLDIEQKVKIVDIMRYENDGKWYVILDEAHKGDTKDSIRKLLYSIMGRNGFLFNFSATFVDDLDLETCAYEFNLARFIEKGHGKQIYVMSQETIMLTKEKYTEFEKQVAVLKSLLMLAFVSICRNRLLEQGSLSYHLPLNMVLVDKVNTRDADLKIFFRILSAVCTGKIETGTFSKAKADLIRELRNGASLTIPNIKTTFDLSIIQKMDIPQLLHTVFHSKTHGEIEVIYSKKRKQEITLKLKTSTKPFGLIRIGDISKWLKEELHGYAIQERFLDRGVFETLNENNSSITILMGSRSFYEGWDSNRPNVITLIGIGSRNAGKFVLQSIGRGIRIEPIPHHKKRLKFLEIGVTADQYLVNAIETLFVIGTKKKDLKIILLELEREKNIVGNKIEGISINEIAHKKPLLIPVYSSTNKDALPIISLSPNDFKMLQAFLGSASDDRLLLMRYAQYLSTTDAINQLTKLRKWVEHSQHRPSDRNYGDLDSIMRHVILGLDNVPHTLKELKELDVEIDHFNKIAVHLKRIDLDMLHQKVMEISDAILEISSYPKRISELQKKAETLSPEKFLEQMGKIRKSITIPLQGSSIIEIHYVDYSYYYPVLIAQGNPNLLSHAIDVESEINFIRSFISYATTIFKDFDWVIMSRIDEKVDKVFIPYFNPKSNKINRFFPDFILWAVKGNDYSVILVDPKSTEYVDGYRKIEGFQKMFESNGSPKTFQYKNYNVRFYLKLMTPDKNRVLSPYKKYWYSQIYEIVE